MAVTETQIKTAKPLEKSYTPTDGRGLALTHHFRWRPTAASAVPLRGSRERDRLGLVPCHWPQRGPSAPRCCPQVARRLRGSGDCKECARAGLTIAFGVIARVAGVSTVLGKDTGQGELRVAGWGEFNLDTEHPQWCIPAERMKMKEQHAIWLAYQAGALLRELLPFTGRGRFLSPIVLGAVVAAICLMGLTRP